MAKYLSENDLAPRIGFAVATVRRWRQLRVGPPYYKIGRTVRYSWPEIVAWLASARIEPEGAGKEASEIAEDLRVVPLGTDR